MLDAWTGEVKGRCHVAQIPLSMLADESGYTVSYLSEIINGRKCTDETRTRIFEALSRLEERVRKGEAENENHSVSDSSNGS